MDPAMDGGDPITVTKLELHDQRGFLMIGWQSDSFELYLYLKDNILWNGTFSSNRLEAFSRNLQMTEKEYYKSLKRCLTQQQDNYLYEINNGFFYWKRKLKDSMVIEGFLPIEMETSEKSTQLDLVEILLALNKQLQHKVNDLKNRFQTIKSDYQKCLRDTEEFLDLKIEMERALSEKFLNLLNLQKSKVSAADGMKKDKLKK